MLSLIWASKNKYEYYSAIFKCIKHNLYTHNYISQYNIIYNI